MSKKYSRKCFRAHWFTVQNFQNVRCNETQTGTKETAVKASFPAVGKREWISSCNCVDKTTSPIILKFSKSSIVGFDYNFGNIFFLMNNKLLKYWILALNSCGKYVEISDCKMDLTGSVGYSLLVHVLKYVIFILSWTRCTSFKICR